MSDVMLVLAVWGGFFAGALCGWMAGWSERQRVDRGRGPAVPLWTDPIIEEGGTPTWTERVP